MSRRCNCPGCMLGPSATMRLIIIGPAGHTANRTSSCCDQRTRTVDLALEWHPSTRTIHQLQDLSQLGRAGLSIFASLHDLLFQLFHLRRQQEAFTLEPSNNCLPLLQLLAEAVCVLLRTHVLRVGGLSTAFTLCPGLVCTMGGPRHAKHSDIHELCEGSLPAALG